MTAKNNRVLLLFTSAFPYGKGEQFIETEIRFLAEVFAEVHIFPLTVKGEARALPSNVIVREFRFYQAYPVKKMFLKHFLTLVSIFSLQVRLSAHRGKYVKNMRKQFLYLLHRVNDAYRLHHLFGSYEGKDVVFYSYWFNLWMAALCMQKRLGLLHHQLLTRAHGGDYDEAQKKEGYFPFREFELKQIERLLPVSYYGKTYLERKYPFYRGQLSVAYLGVTDKGDNPFKDDAPFHLVSCSFLIPLKRVHLIIEILEHIGLPVKWTHIGEGELMSEVRARAAKLPSSVSVEFPGHLSNDKVMEFYGKTPIDLFVNVSELEGVPVSIMEAISFGIPVTGCRICGVPEIVTDATGFLFEKDFDPIREAHRLKEYLLLPATAKEEFRKGVKAFWRARFNANVNYPAFIEGQLFPLK